MTSLRLSRFGFPAIIVARESLRLRQISSLRSLFSRRNLLSSLAVSAAKFCRRSPALCAYFSKIWPFFFCPPPLPTSAAVIFFPPLLVTDVPAFSRNRRMAVDNSQPFPVSFLFPGPYCIRESRDSRLKLRCCCC